MDAAQPRFVADGNVGTLARRLRMLGFDATFAHPVADDELVRVAEREGRVLLTRDVYVLHRRPIADGTVRAVLITRDDVASQVRQVLRALDLHPPFAAFSLCLECNVALVPVAPSEVEAEVPHFVFQTQDAFTRCPRCRRIYWSGTHRRHMLRGAVENGWRADSGWLGVVGSELLPKRCLGSAPERCHRLVRDVELPGNLSLRSLAPEDPGDDGSLPRRQPPDGARDPGIRYPWRRILDDGARDRVEVDFVERQVPGAALLLPEVVGDSPSQLRFEVRRERDAADWARTRARARRAPSRPPARDPSSQPPRAATGTVRRRRRSEVDSARRGSRANRLPGTPRRRFRWRSRSPGRECSAFHAPPLRHPLPTT